jgi:SAM-dependent methyltransferase
MDPIPGSEPPSAPAWTGERLVAGADGDAIAEHLHRYALARELAAGRAVLDVACGEGYGSALLAEVAQSVTGVDIDAAAVAHAAAKYRRGNLRFSAGSATAIPLADATVDLAVSFETIEHLAEHDAMLAEIRRVLRPGGALLISSPDRREYTEAAHYRNPFHVRELDAAEFEALLRRHFAHVRLHGQRMIYGSAIDGADGTAFRVYAGDFEQVRSAAGIAAPRYLVAICSDAPLPALPASVFEDALERRELDSAGRVFRVHEKKRARWMERLRRFFSKDDPWVRLAPELACKIRSFTVTLAGEVSPAVTAVRVRLRDRVFDGRVDGRQFVVEVNFGSGRHPCAIEVCEAGGNWRVATRVRVEAPDVTFQAHERGA